MKRCHKRSISRSKAPSKNLLSHNICCCRSSKPCAPRGISASWEQLCGSLMKLRRGRLEFRRMHSVSEMKKFFSAFRQYSQQQQFYFCLSWDNLYGKERGRERGQNGANFPFHFHSTKKTALGKAKKTPPDVHRSIRVSAVLLLHKTAHHIKIHKKCNLPITAELI